MWVIVCRKYLTTGYTIKCSFILTNVSLFKENHRELVNPLRLNRCLPYTSYCCLPVQMRCVFAVSDWVVSLCVCHAAEQAERKVVLSKMYGRTQEETYMTLSLLSETSMISGHQSDHQSKYNHCLPWSVSKVSGVSIATGCYDQCTYCKVSVAGIQYTTVYYDLWSSCGVSVGGRVLPLSAMSSVRIVRCQWLA